LTLVVIPSVYLVSERIKDRLSWVWRIFGRSDADDERNATEPAEPAEPPAQA
jgi:hypothetical protein